MVTPPRRERDRVAAMFDRIAPRYDLVNTIMSGGMDRRWRARAAAAALPAGGSALDVACGSGALTAVLRRRAHGGLVAGVDVSGAMLRLARRRAPDGAWMRGDALALPFADGSFDAATIAFGLRNLSDAVAGLREMARVARRVVVLEFLRPPASPVGRVQRAYLTAVVPRVGGAVSGDRAAYAYLRDTVLTYHTAAELVALMRESGLRDVTATPLTLGTVAVVTGVR